MSHTSPRLTVDQARAGALERVNALRDSVDDAQYRHERAVDRVDKLTRRLAALELEIADVERERDQAAAKLLSARGALEAAEGRLQALNERS